MSDLRSDVVGVAVTCVVCRQRKCPRGRSAPAAASYCDWDCPGYTQEPHAGSLWPGESEEEFGYPVSDVGTRKTPPRAAGDGR